MMKEVALSVLQDRIFAFIKGIIKPFYRMARKVKIYYYDEKDRENKIFNLIKMTETQTIEDDLYSKRLELLPSEG